MDDLVAEGPIEGDASSGRIGVLTSALIWVTAAAMVPFSATVMVAACPRVPDGRSRTGSGEVGIRTEGLLESQFRQQAHKILLVLVVPLRRFTSAVR